MTPKKTVLITGCSDGGIGSALAAALHAKGYHVYAGLRNRARASALAHLEHLDIIDLDVLSAASIAAAVGEITRLSGRPALDMLINNAGTSLVAPLLDADVAQARRLFDLNFWACLDMVQAFAPLLIAARGTVVNVSSIAAVLPLPWTGVYAASKAAVASLSESLRIELEPLGVRVVTGMVGTVDTRIFSNLEPVRLPEDSHYLSNLGYLEGLNAGKDVPQGMDVGKFADRLAGDLVGGATGRVWRGGSASIAWFASRFLPNFVVDIMLRAAGRLANVKVARSSKL